MKGSFNSKSSTKIDIDQKIEKICVETGKWERLEYLVKKTQSIAQLRFDGWSPLQAAAFNLHLEVVTYFIQHALVPVDIRDQIGCTALHLATWRGAEQITQLFLNPNPTYEPFTYKKYNHVHYAIIGGHLKTVKFLSKYGRRAFESPNQDGFTPFILACKIGRLDIVKYLHTTYKFDLEITDNHHCTALHHACWEGHPRVASYLIRHHANVHTLDNLGQSPLDVCQSIEMKEMIMSIVHHHERADPEPIRLPDTAPPPVPQQPQQRIYESHDTYLSFIEGLRNFVDSIQPVGKGVSNSSTLLLLHSNESESSATNSLFEEIKIEVNHDPNRDADQDDDQDLSFVSSQEKTEINIPPQSPSPEQIEEQEIQVDQITDQQQQQQQHESPSLELSTDLIIPPFIDNSSIDLERAPSPLTLSPSPPPSPLPATEQEANGNENGNENGNGHSHSHDNETDSHSHSELLLDSQALDPLVPTDGRSTPTFTTQPDSSNSDTSILLSDTFTSTSTLNTPTTDIKTTHLQAEDIKPTQQLKNSTPSNGVQSLVWSICKRNGDILALKTLVQRHPEALQESLRDSKGFTPLQCAIAAGHTDIVKYLLEREAYVSITDSSGNTPFQFACFLGIFSVVKLFLSFNQNLINLVNSEGYTPLHLACRHGYLEVVRLLIEEGGASLDAVNWDGHTAYEIAKKFQHESILNYMNSLNSDTDETTKESDNPTQQLPVDEDCDYYLENSEKPQYVELEEEEEEGEEGEEGEGQGQEEDQESISSIPSMDHSSQLENEQNFQVIIEKTIDTHLQNHHDDDDPLRNHFDQNGGQDQGQGQHEDSLNPKVGSRQPLIEICNGVIFEEFFDDEDDDDVVVPTSDHLEENGRNYHEIVSIPQENPSKSTQTDGSDVIEPKAVDENNETALVSENPIPSPTHHHQQTNNILRFLFLTNHLFSLRQSHSLAKRFFSWKFLQPPPKKQHNFITMIKIMTSFFSLLHRLVLRTLLSDVFQHWKTIPRKIIHEIESDLLIFIPQETPHSTPFHSMIQQNVAETDETPLLQGLTPNIPGITPMTPQSDHHVVQRLRFNDVVNITVVENLQEKEEKEEEDLMALGPLPNETLPIFKANEMVLWEMLTFYVTNKLNIPSQKTEEKKRITKRIISSGSLWNLFSDFSVCPTVCSKTSLKNIIDSLLSPNQLPTVFLSPLMSRPKIKSNDAVVSFLGFQKILWAIARDCLDAPSATDPVSRILSLFSRLESSQGRKKMASHGRNAHVLPPFVLYDPSQKKLLKEKRESPLKKSTPSAKMSPESMPSTSVTSPMTETSPIATSIVTSIPSSPTVASSTSVTLPTVTTTTIPAPTFVAAPVATSSPSPKPKALTHLNHPSITDFVTPFGGLGASNSGSSPSLSKSKSKTKEIHSIEPEKIINSTPKQNESVSQNKDTIPSQTQQIHTLPVVNPPQKSIPASPKTIPSSPKTIPSSQEQQQVPNGGKEESTIKTNHSIIKLEKREPSPMTELSSSNSIKSTQSPGSVSIPITSHEFETKLKIETEIPIKDSIVTKIPMFAPTILSQEPEATVTQNQPPQKILSVITNMDTSSSSSSTSHHLPSRPPLSPWSSSRVLGTQSSDCDPIAPSPTPDDTLEELTKAPVADRVNAKLAAKQFEALVSKMKTESVRGISPVRERPTLISPKTVPTQPESEKDSVSSLPKFKRSSMPLRRNQSERSYTQSIWLTDSPEETKVSDATPEPLPPQPLRRPPAPMLRRASERTSIGIILATTSTSPSPSLSSSSSTNDTSETKVVDNQEVKQQTVEPLKPPTPSRREMWGQTLKDEGKVQGALSLWRQSARDFHRIEEVENEEVVDEETASTNPDLDLNSEMNTSKNYLSDGEFPSDSENPVTPNARNRKRRGSVTRRR